MGLRNLSEAIILQSAADLLSSPNEEEALEFFSGEGFRLCAETAKMSHDDKLVFLEMLAESISARRKTEDRPIEVTHKKAVKGWTAPHRGRKSAVAARSA